MINKKSKDLENLPSISTMKRTNHNDYLTELFERHYSKLKNVKNVKKNIKIENDEAISIPKLDQYDMIVNINYNVTQLKTIAKSYKLKSSGNKTELVGRLYSFLYTSYAAQKIQKYMRGFIQRKFDQLHGPALKKRHLCTNDTDFLTCDYVKDIPYNQFISFKDKDEFVYGFDIISIYNLIKKKGDNKQSNNLKEKNPYNREELDGSINIQVHSFIRLSKILKMNVVTEIKDVSKDITPTKNIELRIRTLFQNIDALGNYSDPKWLLDLSRQQLTIMNRELLDIWSYRAPLTIETKRNICPPYGNPFQRHISIGLTDNIDDSRKYIVEVLEKFVNSGVDKDSKCLGAYYVLGSLTLVSEPAAQALPWLYQAVAHTY